MTETQQRFLREIAERVSPDRVLELYLFPSIRQGGMESGVAVFAAEEERAFSPEEDADVAASAVDDQEPLDPDAPAPITRFVVYSASYRLTLKGHERGAWDAEVTAEADAPLHTIDDVVRGVQKRTGERGDAHRLTGDAFRSALIEPAWAVHD
ncbi:MAG TPA: hypothetical protein VFG84_00600 [Gemmatimonadaceae bacterium]|nr:hypothetical protein [Gemmatimonadaceae bacterium]